MIYTTQNVTHIILGVEKFPNSFSLMKEENGSMEEIENKQTEEIKQFQESENPNRNSLSRYEVFKSQEL